MIVSSDSFSAHNTFSTLIMIIDITRWGPGVFSYYHHWWIVPVIATHAGAVAGAWIYYLAIEVIVFVVVVVVVAVVVVAGAWIYYLAIEVLQSSN